VSWTSSNIAIAQVANVSATLGLVTGLGVGNIPIAATQWCFDSTTVTVVAATLVSIIVTPANPTVLAGTKLTLTAIAVFSNGTMQDVTAQANRISSENNVAHILSTGSSKPNLRLVAKNPGTTTITATIPTLGNAQRTVVTVTP
jgi:hypothetical protein